jgi:hypothetical protein
MPVPSRPTIHRLAVGLLALFLTEVSMRAQSSVPAPASGVLTVLTVRPDAARDQVMKALPEETRETLTLYLDGKISHWFGRADGKGVVFILDCSTVAEAKALTDTLPFAKLNLATFDYLPLTPLTPLRTLLMEPPRVPKD